MTASWSIQFSKFLICLLKHILYVNIWMHKDYEPKKLKNIKNLPNVPTLSLQKAKRVQAIGATKDV